jgi:hypothetical protein
MWPWKQGTQWGTSRATVSKNRCQLPRANHKSRQRSSLFSESREIRVVHKEFVPPDVTVNQKNIISKCWIAWERARWGFQRKLQTFGPLQLHHYISPAHTHRRQFVNFRQKKVHSLLPPRPLILPKLKSRLKGYHFQALDSIQKAATDVIMIKTEADF